MMQIRINLQLIMARLCSVAFTVLTVHYLMFLLETASAYMFACLESFWMGW